MSCGGFPPLSSIAAAQPGGSARIFSGGNCGALERVRVQRPLSLCEVRHTPRLPPSRETSSADSGTTWRWAISEERLPSTCSSSWRLPSTRRSESS
jgi:hypothetical protein